MSPMSSTSSTPSTPSMSVSHSSLSPIQSKEKTLYHLCIIQAAATQCCMTRSCVKYASSDSTPSHALTDFEKFLCKLAQVSDTEKGGLTNTALTCLLAPHGGAELVFTSNFRKEGELRETKAFLEKLLVYVSQNPDDLGSKAHQKKTLWLILEHNVQKVKLYLKALTSHLKECINDCESNEGVLNHLRELAKRVNFPYDMAEPNAKNKFLSDCETFIKAIHASRSSPISKEIKRLADESDFQSAYKWHQLIHHLGRMHSYRVAAEVIVEAPKNWPDLFRSFKITPIPSAPRKKIPSILLPESADLDHVLSVAFPETDLPDLGPDMKELRAFGFDEKFAKETHDRKFRTVVHAEVHIHNYLVREGKTNPSDFWNDSLFIATSKPPCQLCHYYFESSDNGFRTQSPHPNLYKKLRFPDDCNEDVLDDIIEQLEVSTLKLLKEKLPKYKRNDSSTDTRGYNSRASYGTDGSSYGRRSAQKAFHGMDDGVAIAEESDDQQSDAYYDDCDEKLLDRAVGHLTFGSN